MLGVLADPSGGDVAEVGANHTAVQLLTESTLPWLFGNTTNGTALSIGGEQLGARSPGLCAACVGLPQALGQGVLTAIAMPGPYWVADGTAHLAVAAAVARCLLHRVLLGLHSTLDVPLAARARCRLQHGAHQRWQAALLGALHRRDQVRLAAASDQPRRGLRSGAAALLGALGCSASWHRLPPLTVAFTLPGHAPLCAVTLPCSHLPTLVSNAARLSSWQYQAAVSFLQGERPSCCILAACPPSQKTHARAQPCV